MIPKMVGISGATGKMGRLIIRAIIQRCAVNSTEWHISSMLGLKMQSLQDMVNEYKLLSDIKLTTEVDVMINNSNIIIDFSASEVTRALSLALTKCTGKTVIIGTTGLTDTTLELLQKVSVHHRICHTPNTSFGIAVMHSVIKKMSCLFDTYDAEIQEVHHNQKTDSPSGTALYLGQAIAQGRNMPHRAICHNEQIRRNPGQIGYAVMRGGDVMGEHTVNFFGHNEMISVQHRVLKRELFADGALQLVDLLCKKTCNGLFTVADLLNISS